jgi:hypothetical protein
MLAFKIYPPATAKVIKLDVSNPMGDTGPNEGGVSMRMFGGKKRRKEQNVVAKRGEKLIFSDLQSLLKSCLTFLLISSCQYSLTDKVVLLRATISRWFICNPCSCPSSLYLYIPYLCSLVSYAGLRGRMLV